MIHTPKFQRLDCNIYFLKKSELPTLTQEGTEIPNKLIIMREIELNFQNMMVSQMRFTKHSGNKQNLLYTNYYR